jgi:CTP:phosphocholine cytidylyltransferase-like protein
MAQAMIVEEKLKYLKRDSRSIGIQTGVDNEMYFYLTNKISARVYYSTVYKQTVISFNLGNSKSFIIDHTSWSILKNNFEEIDKRFNCQ